MRSFKNLGLSAHLLDAIRTFGWEKPTPIQSQVIPQAIAGHDILGCAQTGTGKTGAFVLPMVERLAGKHGLQGLVLCPTREIALQTQEDFDHFGPLKGVRAVSVIGGASMHLQLQALKKQPTVLIATPGRLLDHLERKSVRLSTITILVIDEADRMLDMGFMPQISRILHQLPPKHHHQTMLFSATLPPTIEQLIRHHLHNPIRINAAASGTPAAGAVQGIYVVEMEEKRAALFKLLEEIPGPTLVFTRTKRGADHVTRFLEKSGAKVACIHSDRSQRERQQALNHFKHGTCRILVATDIIARGIDVEGIAHVINFNIPHSPDDYIHRIGRTARAAMSGHASTIVSPEEITELITIEKRLGAPLPRRELPGITTTMPLSGHGSRTRRSRGAGGRRSLKRRW